MRYVLDARTATDHFPGIGRYVFNLAQAIIPQLAPAETLILLRHPAASSPWNLASLAGEKVTVVDAPVSPFAPAQQWQIPRLLCQLKADLYHSPYYLMPYRPGVPTLLTVYDLIPLVYPRYFPFETRLIFRLATALALKVAGRVAVISNASRNDLLQFFPIPAQKTTAIPLAADPVFKPQPAETIAHLRRKLSLPEEYTLYFGSNKPHKNLARLVDAWAKIQPQPGPLIIAGFWDLRYPEAKDLAAALNMGDKIRFLGRVEEIDLPALYSAATAFIFPSEYEGFGLPVLEAMACGTPVACANTSSLPEVAGEAALLFDGADSADMARALSTLLADPARQADLRQRGFERAGQFSWAQTAQKTLALYRRSG